MASFGAGIGDAIIVSRLCYSLYQACTSGRRGAPAAVFALAEELWACSTALDQVSGAVSRLETVSQTTELQVAIKRTIKGCQESLELLQNLIDKYKIVNEEHPSRGAFKWTRKIQIGVRKSRWMYEEADIQRIRSRVASNVQSLNLLLGVMTG